MGWGWGLSNHCLILSYHIGYRNTALNGVKIHICIHIDTQLYESTLERIYTYRCLYLNSHLLNILYHSIDNICYEITVHKFVGISEVR